jgi:Glycosyl transferases group 1
MSPRLLYVDINASFINPTRSLLPLALLHACDVTFFGPGHVPSDVLARGLPAFIDAHGPFDMAASNTLLLFSETADPISYSAAVMRSYVYEGPREDLLFLPIIAKQFKALSLPRLAILLENDFYNWTERERDWIEASADIFIGFGEEFTPYKDTLPHLMHERFGYLATDIWADFCRRKRDKVASLLHFISDAEFVISPIALRPHLWSVMGIQYYARGLARDQLAKDGIVPVGDTKLRRVVHALKRLKLIRGEKKFIQKALNADFANRISKTRYSYTCGSGLDMPIRKFFEIPALGTLLVCRPFTGFAAAGFQDGVNCIVAEPNALGDVTRDLRRDPMRVDALARAGQKFIFDHHSIEARARDLQSIIEAVAQNRFYGSHWVNGQHHLRPSPTGAEQ